MLATGSSSAVAPATACPHAETLLHFISLQYLRRVDSWILYLLASAIHITILPDFTSQRHPTHKYIKNHV
jgi:hypothetical protein